MDLRLPDSTGVETTARLRKEFPKAKIIVISSYDGDEDIYRAFQAGARAYLLKDVLGEELFRAIKSVHGGGQYIPASIARSLAEHNPGSDLTQRELEVLQLLIKGLSNKEIGEVLRFTENTAKFHIKNILSKLGVSDRTEAATAAFQRGILR
jgi:two-component system NarL family response regulator